MSTNGKSADGGESGRPAGGGGFLRQFLTRPTSVGAIAPSSRWLARAMVASGDLANADCVVELGPGTGAFTPHIAAAVGDETTFFAIELNEAFVEATRKRCPGVTVYHGSAEKLAEFLGQHDKTAVDCILCGLPWASLPIAVQESVMAEIVRLLRPGGVFATFAYIHALCLPNARKFRRRLEANFSDVGRSSIVWRNLPPAFVYRCRK